MNPLKRKFDFGGGDPERFEKFICELRDYLMRELPSTSRANIPDGVYVLTPEERRPRQWLHLTMVDHDDEIILWIRTDNLYIVGFEQRPQRTGQAGRRYEFNNSTTPGADDPEHNKDKYARKNKGNKQEHPGGQSHEPLIPGARFLGINSGYHDLGLNDGVLGTTNFGYRPLENAIHGLARYVPSATGGIQTKYLITMAVTISESLRLHDICQFIGQLLRYATEGHLTLLMFRYIQHWRAISACVFNACATNNDPSLDPYRTVSENCEIENTAQACRIVAILKYVDIDKKQKKNKRSKRDEAAALDVLPQASSSWQGLTFVEIFSAVVISTGGRHNDHLLLYGHITIDDGFTCQRLFTRRRSDAAPPRSADGNVELTGPARAVWGYDEIVMHVDLMVAVPGVIADMTPDSDEVGSGKLVWNTYDTTGMVYDEVEEYVFEGVSGAVNVRCAVLTNAVVATVALRRTGGGGSQEQQVDVYGTVSAATAMLLPRDKVTLFNRGRKDAFSVGANEDVPLLRNLAVVPLDSPLVICANLWTRAYVVDMSPDDHISSGAVAVFHPSPFGVFRKVISSNDDYELEVSVTWSIN